MGKIILAVVIIAVAVAFAYLNRDMIMAGAGKISSLLQEPNSTAECVKNLVLVGPVARMESSLGQCETLCYGSYGVTSVFMNDSLSRGTDYFDCYCDTNGCAAA